MKKAAFFMALVLVLFSPNPVLGQIWVVNDEFEYFPFPVGGWNTLGSHSPRSTGMGETLFGSSDGTSGYLNPAFLTFVERPQLSLSFRHSENRYRTTLGKGPDPYDFGSGGEPFERSTDYLDSIGMAAPFRGWSLAVDFFLFQEFNFPEIDIRSGYAWHSLQQSGEARGLNLGLSRRLLPWLSLGISASYVFGDINRRVPGYRHSSTYDLHLKGHYFSFGAAFEPGENWKIGVALRPPFSLDVDSEMELDHSNPAWVPLKTTRFAFRQPLVVVGSVLYRPVASFDLTADISYWDWSHVISDLALSGYSFQNFRSAFKLNLGAERRIPLHFPPLKELYMRAGYIHDPQFFLDSNLNNYSRDYVCAGLGLSAWNLEIALSAKIRLSPREFDRFYANMFQAGAAYRF